MSHFGTKESGLTCEHSQVRESPSPAFNTTPSKNDSGKELAGQGQKYSEMDESYVTPISREMTREGPNSGIDLSA